MACIIVFFNEINSDEDGEHRQTLPCRAVQDYTALLVNS